MRIYITIRRPRRKLVLAGCGVIALLLLLATATAGIHGADAAAPPVQTRDIILAPFPFTCELSAEGAETWVYCWEGDSPIKRHVKLEPDGEVSQTATAPLPTGIGGPGVPYGAWYTIGDFRCEVLRQGIECVVISTGKGFLITRNRITEVQTPAGLSEPAPVFGRSANFQPVSGEVLIKEPGEKFARPLNANARLPFGTLVDARTGTVQLTTAASPEGGTQTGQFRAGQFRVTQDTKRTRAPDGSTVVGLTVLTLAGPLPACGGAHASDLSPRTKPAGPRHLWGNAHGNFQTGGKYASATVGGTKWLTEDSCKGTKVKVVRGVVDVEDLKTHRTTSVTGGHSLLVGSGLTAKKEAPRAGRGTCIRKQTSVELYDSQPGLGTRYSIFSVRNDGTASCRMRGFPRVVARTFQGQRVLSQNVVEEKAESVEIPAGGRAEFMIGFPQPSFLPPHRCHPGRTANITVYLPGLDEGYALRFREPICTRPRRGISVRPIEEGH
jgi:hypothetical protein